jgi:hypothetical protein
MRKNHNRIGFLPEVPTHLSGLLYLPGNLPHYGNGNSSFYFSPEMRMGAFALGFIS